MTKTGDVTITHSSGTVVGEMAMLRQLRATVFGEMRPHLYRRDMEPAERFVRRLLKFALMILAFIVSIVFGEFYRGMGWSVDCHSRSFNGRAGHVSLEGSQELTAVVKWRYYANSPRCAW